MCYGWPGIWTRLTFWSVPLSEFLSFSEHTKKNHLGQIQSPGFPNRPYGPNTFIQWQLRADPNYVIKLDFDTMNLEENCKNDFVKIYDSLVAIESRVMEEWVCIFFTDIWAQIQADKETPLTDAF